MRTEVAIIGGGIMGCAIAWRLAQRGVQVTVIERGVPGAEASSAAAGMLAPQEENKAPGPLLALGLASRERWPDFAEALRSETGVDPGYRRSGLLALGAPEELAERAAWQTALGLRAGLIDGAALARLEPTLHPEGQALYLPDEGQVEPPLLMKALQLAAARAGARFTTGYVRRVLAQGGRVNGVELEGERIEAERVVLAAGSWSALIEGAGLPARSVSPMRGQLVELETRTPLLTRIVFAPGGYLVPRADGRVVVGSTMEEAGWVNEVTADGLHHVLSLARRVVPALGAATVRRHWANFRPRTADLLPLVGEAPAPLGGLFLATGHFRNGILLAPITADVLSALVTGAPSPVDIRALSPARLATPSARQT